MELDTPPCPCSPFPCPRWTVGCFTKTPFLELGLRLQIFFRLDQQKQCLENTLFTKIVFSIPTGPKTAKKWPKMAKKNFGPKILVFCYRDLALAVPVVLAPSEAFFDFSFPSYSRFREGTPQMRQNFCNSGCRNFAAFEGFPHENGYNSEMKSRKMLLKVPKRLKRRGLKTV